VPRRTVAWIVGFLLVLAAAGIFFVADRDDPSYVGTTRRVTLQWGQCFNGISWPPSAKRDSYYWWAGGSPAPKGDILTVPPLREHSSALHYARGTLHFTSRSTAIFRSDAGGTLEMRRESTKAFHTTGCSLGFANP
jgi:hypothetical protein